MKVMAFTCILFLTALILTVPGYAGTCVADLTGDGNVDGEDLALMAAEFGTADCSTTLVVDCGNGDTIAGALAVADPGDTIQVSGTCNESILLYSPNHDRVILDGQGTAVLDGQGQTVVTVDGSRGVVIQGFIIKNGLDGVLVEKGASALLDGVTVQGNADDGIQVDENASAVIRDCRVGGNQIGDKNQNDGIFVFRSSSATLNGTVTSTGNGDNGINVGNSSSLFSYGATATLQDNTGHGLMVNNNSALFLFGKANWTVGPNGGRGISVVGSSHMGTNQSSGTIQVTGNGSYGLHVSESSDAGLSGAAMEITNSGNNGILVFLSSSVWMANTTTVTSNRGYGVGVARASSFHVGQSGWLTVSETIFVQNSHPGAGIGVFDGSSFGSDGGKVTLRNNASDGLMTARSASIWFSSTANVSITDNGRNGVGLYENSSCDMDGGVNISSNASGIVADDGSTLDMTGCTVTGNPSVGPQQDVVLRFGARGTFNGNTIGVLQCEGTALSRGNLLCP